MTNSRYLPHNRRSEGVSGEAIQPQPAPSPHLGGIGTYPPFPFFGLQGLERMCV